MAKENVYDRVLTETQNRIERVTDQIGKNFKGVKPFDKVPIPKQELSQAYQGLSNDDMNILIQKHGEEVVNQFIFEMEQEKLNG